MGVEVVDAVERDRYEISVDGVLAGFATYQRRGDTTDIDHAEIDDAFGGRGLGGALAQAALDAERAAGRHVVPHCPFVAHWIATHPAYAELVEGVHRHLLDG